MSKYSLDGKKDEFNNIISRTSLKNMLSSQPDFINEWTILQYIEDKLGITIDRIPKYYPEMAGEGIEYMWGIIKMKYHTIPFNKKKLKADFHKSVDVCLSPLNITIIDKVRRCARHARDYITTYNNLHQVKLENNVGTEEIQVLIPYVDIEKMVKE